MSELLPQEYELTDITTLTPHPDNPRQGDTHAIAESVRANGFYGALVANRHTRHVLAGNHRLAAAQKQGLTELPVIWVDVDNDTARRILLADNRTGDIADNDDRLLAELLTTLDDLDGTGYTEGDLDALTQALQPPNTENWDDAFTNLPDGDRQYVTRSFHLTAEQAETVDRALDPARTATAEEDGNTNAAALTHICATYNTKTGAP